MNAVTALARPEIRNLRSYRAAQYEAGLLRLNANETPWRPPGDDSAEGLNHYPEVRPIPLTRALGKQYGVDPGAVLVTETADGSLRSVVEPEP